MFRLKRYAALLILCSSLPVLSSTEDLGAVGKTWPIEEPDLFVQIANKLQQYEQSGRLGEIKELFAKRVHASIEYPPPVAGITRTKTPRVFFHDPTITLRQDIVTPNGEILARNGDQFNPLDYIPMNQLLLFVDGTDREQLDWARKQLSSYDRSIQVSLILVDGPVLRLSKQWKQQIFFDQKGALTEKFAIRQVPARVSRDGNLLRIEEVEL